MKTLSSSTSQGIGLLGGCALRCLKINADSCVVAPLVSLSQLTKLIISSCTGVKADNVSIHGLSEGVAGMQGLSYLKLPRAPSAYEVLPCTLKVASFDNASTCDVIGLASCAGLPSLKSVEGFRLCFLGIKNMSDARRAGAVLGNRWQPGAHSTPVKFECVYGVLCLDAFLHICSCIPNYSCHHLTLLTTTDIKSNSWDKLRDFGVSVSGEPSTQTNVPGFS